MDIERHIALRAKQTMVYWGNPVAGADGVFVFNAPVELLCFWIETVDSKINKAGREIISKAEIFVKQDVDVFGFVYLGFLSDLTAAEKTNPKEKDTAYEIQLMIKKQSLYNQDKFMRKLII